MNKRNDILDVAQRLLQQRGFNGFSYADIAAEVGIRKASIHHHFPNKIDLAKALLQSYTDQVTWLLQDFMQNRSSAQDRLAGYINLYSETLAANRVCLGGMLASDIHTLDISLKPELIAFFSASRTWLVEVLEQGQINGEIRSDQPPAMQADLVLAGLQGALMLARSHEDELIFTNTAEALIANLRPLAD